MSKDKKEVKDEISKEQIIYNRKQSKRILKVDMECLRREKGYKQNQLSSGKVVEKNESKLYNASSFPKDEVKPKFILENEIKVIERLLEEKQDQLDNLKKSEEEDATKSG